MTTIEQAIDNLDPRIRIVVMTEGALEFIGWLRDAIKDGVEIFGFDSDSGQTLAVLDVEVRAVASRIATEALSLLDEHTVPDDASSLV